MGQLSGNLVILDRCSQDRLILRTGLLVRRQFGTIKVGTFELGTG